MRKMTQQPYAPLLLAGMALGLALFTWGAALHMTLQLHGLLLFAALALVRPDLALLFVPFSVPLYLMPVQLAGLRDGGLLVPLHEITLVLAGAAAATRGISGWLRGSRNMPRLPLPRRELAAPLLLLIAGVIGVALALPEGRSAALRDLRWLILEPLIFWWLLRTTPSSSGAALLACLAGGAMVAWLGLLQFVGLDLVVLLGVKQNFGTPNVIEIDGLRRVTSVYGHPNNLGLYLGRIWPLALSLALVAYRDGMRRRFWLALAVVLPVLAALAVSFSRGAWLGAAAAAAVLAIGVVRPQWRGRALGPLFGMLAVGAIVLGLALSLRGGLGGGSVDARVLLWREAIQLIAEHPLGLGLDQFYFYHNPEFGRSRIDPALIGTSEQYAAHPHNLLLEAWLNVGPLGVVALGIAAWLMAARSSGAARRGDLVASGVLAALIAGLVHGMVDQFYFVEDLAYLFWLLAVLAHQAATTSKGAGCDGPQHVPDQAAAS